MRALLVEDQRKIDYIDTPIPSLKDDEILCRVVYNGICGTDLVIYSGECSFVKDGQIKYPVRIGHEWSGIVEKVGKNVTKFKAGDRVIGDNAVGCGKCEHCLHGNFRDCKDLRSVGTINAWPGAYADFMVMPERHLFHLPDSISMKNGVLIEQMTVAYCGLAEYDIKPETTVAIIGAGPIGLAALAVARAMGCENVTFIGRNDDKLAIATKLGAKHVVNTRKEDLMQAKNEITNGEGFNLVVEASGAVSTIQTAIDLAAFRGDISLMGFFEEPVNNLFMNDVVTKALTIKGVFGGGNVNQIIDFVLKYNIDLEQIITDIISFDEAKDYFVNAHERKSNNIKVLVKISDE